MRLPFALATVIGGIDNTESAIAAGDRYRTRDILLTEALATILAGVCGGVVQNTPYVGHPAYKAMGARAGYTLATGLLIGLGAMGGVVSILVGLVPEAAVAPILIFVGLEITAQAFVATPPRHAPAVALAFVPTTAALVMIELSGILGSLGLAPGAIRGEAAQTLEALRLLGNGFILIGASLGGRGGDDHRSPAAHGRRVPRCGEPRQPLRADPLAARIGRPVLARRERVRHGPGCSPAATASWPAFSCCSPPGGKRRAARPAPIGTRAGVRRRTLDPCAPRCYTEIDACEFRHLPPIGSQRGGFHGTSSHSRRDGGNRRPARRVVRHRSGMGAGAAWTCPAAENAKKNTVAKSDAAVAAGKKLTVDKACTACHGDSGKGDGPGAAALNPKPADWTSAKVQQQTDGCLLWKITTGRGAMPPWAALSETERGQLVQYIRTLKK